MLYFLVCFCCGEVSHRRVELTAKMASRTSYEFTVPDAQPIRKLDETGLNFETRPKGVNRSKACIPKIKPPNFPAHVPQSVMLGSLLEHLCNLYEKDSAKSQVIFKEICKRLESLKIISPVAYLEEYASVRHQYKTSFYSLIKSSLSNLDPKLPLLSAEGIPTDKQQKSIDNDVFDLNASRYAEEFEEISSLGKGAYGMVFKARHKVDGQQYAIKKVHIKDSAEQSKRIHIERIMREVQSLAAMQHGNIVRYHNAWMEHHTTMCEDCDDMSDSILPHSGHNSSMKGHHSNLDNSLRLEFKSSRENSNIGSDISSLHVSRGGKFWNNSTSSSEDSQSNSSMSSSGFSRDGCFSDEESGLQFKADSPVTPPDCDKVICTHGVKKGAMRRVKSFILVSSNSGAWRTSTHNRVQSYSDLKEVAVLRNSFAERIDPVPPHVFFPKDEIVLYIQMQLCQTSLAHWLQDRNAKIQFNANQTGRCEVVDKIMCLDILRQILQALAYVHAKGIMHRDVKPRNILLNGLRPQVLLGDFGLARSALVKQTSLNLSPLEDVTNFLQNEQTTGVGTMIYAAPEQLEGAGYNTKADMYAVGIVLYELLWPIQTQHERVQSISELRRESIPTEFAQSWPKYVSTLKSLLSHNPAERPSAQEVLDSEIFQINTCEGFFDKFANLKEENAMLKERLRLYEQKLKDHGIVCD